MQWATIPAGVPGRGLPAVIEAIGDGAFAQRLFELVDERCGADYVALFRLQPQALHCLSAAGTSSLALARRQLGRYVGEGFWRRDAAIGEALRQCAPSRPPMLARMRPSSLRDHELRDAVYRPSDIADRLMVWRASGASIYGISVLRTERLGEFPSGALPRLAEVAPELLAALSAHDRVTRARIAPSISRSPSDRSDRSDSSHPSHPSHSSHSSVPSCTTADASPSRASTPRPADPNPAAIERQLAALAPMLSPRERATCARIIAGLTAAQIAQALGVGEGSVITYRRRAYAKLGVRTTRELVLCVHGRLDR